MLLLILPACEPSEGAPVVDTDHRDTAAADTAPDTATDTADDTATDTAADTGSDTAADTEPELPASITLSGTYEGVPFDLGCDAGDAGLERGWSNAVGDKVGSFRCTDGGSLSVSFINPEVGTWTDPYGGMGYVYTDAGGGVLSWFEGTPSDWSITFTALEWTAIDAFVLTGSLTGTWSHGTISGAFSVTLPCTNC